MGRCRSFSREKHYASPMLKPLMPSFEPPCGMLMRPTLASGDVLLQGEQQPLGVFRGEDNPAFHFGFRYARQHGCKVENEFRSGVGDYCEIGVSALCDRLFEFDVDLMFFVCHNSVVFKIGRFRGSSVSRIYTKVTLSVYSDCPVPDKLSHFYQQNGRRTAVRGADRPADGGNRPSRSPAVSGPRRILQSR